MYEEVANQKNQLHLNFIAEFDLNNPLFMAYYSNIYFRKLSHVIV